MTIIDSGENYNYTDQDRYRDLRAQLASGEITGFEFDLLVEQEGLSYYE